MSLNEKNIEQVLNLIAAYTERLQEVSQLAVALRTPAFWRATDGSLEVGALSTDDKGKLTERMNKDLDDAELIITTIRGLLAPGPV